MTSFLVPVESDYGVTSPAFEAAAGECLHRLCERGWLGDTRREPNRSASALSLLLILLPLLLLRLLRTTVFETDADALDGTAVMVFHI